MLSTLVLPHHWLFVLMFTAFVAGYVDSIAGGGGMIQLPVLFLAGVPPLFALGTNKIVSMTGTTMAVARYASKRLILVKYVVLLLVPVVIASYIGSRLMMHVSQRYITVIILVCIPIAFFFIIKKKKIIEKKIALSKTKIILFTIPIGFYDGFIGPGTGAYLAIMFNRVLGLDYVRATALAKPINLATNVAAAIAYIIAGKVIWIVGLPMGACSLLGAYTGTHFAIKNGEKFIKKVLIIVLIALLVANVVKLTGLGDDIYHWICR